MQKAIAEVIATRYYERDMNAKTYLETHGRDAAEKLAIAAGTKLSYFVQFASGHRRPSADLAHRLVEKSHGALDFQSLLPAKKKEAA